MKNVEKNFVQGRLQRNLSQKTETRRQGSIIRTVIENDRTKKLPLARPRLRREDCVVVRDVGAVESVARWKGAVEDRNI